MAEEPAQGFAGGPPRQLRAQAGMTQEALAGGGAAQFAVGQ